jgi:RNA polymerase sigma factor (TIGR02999 family)
MLAATARAAYPAFFTRRRAHLASIDQFVGHLTGTSHLNERSDGAGATEVTSLFKGAAAGDPRASADLLPLVYEQLRALAGRRMRQERPDLTLQATALVHEAYLRLVDTADPQLWESRWHFFAAVAESMRRILVDTARRRGRIKRGGEMNRVDLDSLELTFHEPPDQLVALDEALTRLADEHPDHARLVNLRYFGGLTHEEAAEAMGVSVSTADRHWAYARAWLYRHMAAEESRGTDGR